MLESEGRFDQSIISNIQCDDSVTDGDAPSVGAKELQSFQTNLNLYNPSEEDLYSFQKIQKTGAPIVEVSSAVS